MKEILENLFEYNKLDYNQAKRVLIEIASNKYSNTEIASFITAFKMRNPSIEEMEGFRDALLELCVKIDFNEKSKMMRKKKALLKSIREEYFKIKKKNN